MRQPVPTRCDVIPFLRKRAERAHARFASLYGSEMTDAEIDRHLNAVLDYAYENVHKRTGGKPRRRTKKQTDEILSRIEAICGPPVPLLPELDALIDRIVQPEVWQELRELWRIDHASNPTD